VRAELLTHHPAEKHGVEACVVLLHDRLEALVREGRRAGVLADHAARVARPVVRGRRVDRGALLVAGPERVAAHLVEVDAEDVVGRVPAAPARRREGVLLHDLAPEPEVAALADVLDGLAHPREVREPVGHRAQGGRCRRAATAPEKPTLGMPPAKPPRPDELDGSPASPPRCSTSLVANAASAVWPRPLTLSKPASVSGTLLASGRQLAAKSTSRPPYAAATSLETKRPVAGFLAPCRHQTGKVLPKNSITPSM